MSIRIQRAALTHKSAVATQRSIFQAADEPTVLQDVTEQCEKYTDGFYNCITVGKRPCYYCGPCARRNKYLKNVQYI